MEWWHTGNLSGCLHVSPLKARWTFVWIDIHEIHLPVNPIPLQLNGLHSFLILIFFFLLSDVHLTNCKLCRSSDTQSHSKSYWNLQYHPLFAESFSFFFLFLLLFFFSSREVGKQWGSLWSSWSFLGTSL